MFGRRPEGIRVKDVDPIVQVTPYLMPMRCDAMVLVNKEIDLEPLTRYIAEKATEGIRITFMELVIAAYVRGISQCPETNRFIMNRKMYSRTQLTVSFTELLATPDCTPAETTVKVHFDPTDTIFDVANRVNAAVEANRQPEADNGTLKFAKLMVKAPIITRMIAGTAIWLDKHDMLPKAIVDISPFHTSMFITNMASIGMTSVNHHIYNFGNTNHFFSMGTPNRSFVPDENGKLHIKRTLPMGGVADERICAGKYYSMLFNTIIRGLKDPHSLETPPETVRYDKGAEYHEPKPVQAAESV